MKPKNPKIAYFRERKSSEKNESQLQRQIVTIRGKLMWHGHTVPHPWFAFPRSSGWHGQSAWHGATVPLSFGLKSSFLVPIWHGTGLFSSFIQIILL